MQSSTLESGESGGGTSADAVLSVCKGIDGDRVDMHNYAALIDAYVVLYIRFAITSRFWRPITLSHSCKFGCCIHFIFSNGCNPASIWCIKLLSFFCQPSLLAFQNTFIFFKCGDLLCNHNSSLEPRWHCRQSNSNNKIPTKIERKTYRRFVERLAAVNSTR